MQEDKECFFDDVNTLLGCLEIITPFLEATHFNIDVMGKRAQSGYLDATLVLESLVLQVIPFRDAHHQVWLWVAQALQKNCSLKEIKEAEQE